MDLKEIQKKAKENAIKKAQIILEKPEDLENLPTLIDGTKDLTARVHNILFIQSLEHQSILGQVTKIAQKNLEKTQILRKKFDYLF